MEFRSESKFMVSRKDLLILKYKLKNVMPYDSYCNGKTYNVRTIYFDSIDNKCFYDNADGLDQRYKLRIRMYNRSINDIKLECKYKEMGNTKKVYCKINKKLCDKLLNGEQLCYSECNNQVLRKLYIEQKINNFVPKIIIEYDRLAFAEKTGNVRITFDTNIRTSRYLNRFYESNIYARPLLEPNIDILEIKYDELLPDYIKRIVDNGQLSKTSFSKYYLSRLMFEEELI